MAYQLSSNALWRPPLVGNPASIIPSLVLAPSARGTPIIEYSLLLSRHCEKTNGKCSGGAHPRPPDPPIYVWGLRPPTPPLNVGLRPPCLYIYIYIYFCRTPDNTSLSSIRVANYSCGSEIAA